MISKYSINILTIFITILLAFPCNAKKIKVVQSSDNNIVGRSIPSGHTRIAFKTNIKDLSIVSLLDDHVYTSDSNHYQFYIDINLNEDANNGIKPQRIIILKASNAAEYRLVTEELVTGHLYLYQVLIDDFPSKKTLMYSQGSSGIIGFQGSFGARYGGYIRISFPKKKRGINIAEWKQDIDLTNSQHIAYSHLSTIIGSRIGIFDDPFLLYIDVGAGYGCFFRQWENDIPMGDSNFYYSDLLKGPEIDIGTSFSYSILTMSIGTSFLFGNNGKNNIALLFGLGISL